MAPLRMMSLVAKSLRNPLSSELFRNSHPSSFFASTYKLMTRDFSISTETDTQPIENEAKPEIPSSSLEKNQHTSIKVNVNSNLKVSERHDLAMVFSCKVCETRSVKTTCRDSYEKGVVIARCDGCGNLHLIADRLGWFGEPGSVEDFLAARGEEVKRGSPYTMNLTLEDLAGRKET